MSSFICVRIKSGNMQIERMIHRQYQTILKKGLMYSGMVPAFLACDYFRKKKKLRCGSFHLQMYEAYQPVLSGSCQEKHASEITLQLASNGSNIY